MAEPEEISLEEATARTLAEFQRQMADPGLEPVERVYIDLYTAVLPVLTRRMQHWFPRVGFGVVGEACMRLASTIAVQVLFSARANGLDKAAVTDEEFVRYAVAVMRKALVNCKPMYAINTGPRLDS